MPIVSLKELKAHARPGSRFLAVDHAPQRWGLALSNPERTMALPFKTLVRGKFQATAEALARIYREYEVGALIIGLPLNMDGSEGPRAHSVRSFAANLLALKALFDSEPLIAFQDERLTTYEAEFILQSRVDISKKKRQDAVDSQAAAHILQDALAQMEKL